MNISGQIIMLLFIGTCLSVFIPYGVTSDINSDIASVGELTKMIKDTPQIVAFCPTDRDNSLVSTFIQMQPLFPNTRFILSRPTIIREVSKIKTPKSPFLVIWENGKLKTIVGPILDDTTLMTVTDLHVTDRRPVLTDQTGVISALGGAPRTVVALEKDFENVLDFVRSTGSTVGPANVILVQPKVFEAMHVEGNDCVIFRQDDSFLGNIANCTVTDYIAKAAPSYEFANRFTLESKNLVVGVKVPDSNTGSPVHSILGQLGDHYSQHPIDFVIADADFAEAVKRLQGVDWGKWNSNVAFVNFSGKYFYNESVRFTDAMKSEGFSPIEWGQNISAFINDIMSGRVKKVYLSEEPMNPIDPIFHKAVGSDYMSYVSDPKKDVFVLFLRSSGAISTKIFQKYRRLAALINRQSGNSEHYRMLVISIDDNMIEGGFPVLPKNAPVLLLFPAGNKQDVKICPRETFKTMAWFTQKYAAHPHSIPFTLPKEAKLADIEDGVNFRMRGLTPALQKAIKQQMADLRASYRTENQEL